jgi:hypothetical protein
VGEVERINNKREAIKPQSLVEVKIAPVIAASGVLANCRSTDGAARLVQQYQSRGVGPVLRFCAENLPLATNLRAALPAPDAVRGAFDALNDALEEPSDAAFTDAAIAALLDALGKKASASAPQQLAGLAEVIGDDPAAEILDLYPVLAAAPVVVAFGTRLLRQRAIFTPTPAEMAQACGEVHSKLETGKAELFCYVILGDNIDDLVAAYGPQHGPDADESPFDL